MRKLWTFLLVLALIGSALTARAGVRFITDVPQNTIQGKLQSVLGQLDGAQGKLPKVSNSERNRSRCISAGYTKTRSSCGDKVAVRPCPHNTRMFKGCCDREYSHSKEYCLSRGLKPSRRSCEGMYACE